jgi:hypothetical protein
MLDAGHDHGTGVHFQPAWNNDVGKNVNIVGDIIGAAMQL